MFKVINFLFNFLLNSVLIDFKECSKGCMLSDLFKL